MFPPQQKEARCTQLHTHTPLLFSIDLSLLTHRCRRDNDFNGSNSTRACPAAFWAGLWVLTQFSRLPLHFNERAFWNEDRFKVLKSHSRIIAAATVSSYSHSLSFPLAIIVTSQHGTAKRRYDTVAVSWCFTPSQPVRLYQGEYSGGTIVVINTTVKTSYS